MSSVLDDVKHAVGLLPSDPAFDSDIKIHINSAFSTLTQLGVGPILGHEITSKDDQWEDFTDDVLLNSVKSYVILRVKLLFDPPGTGFVIASMERQIQELEWRLNVVADYG